MSILKKIFSSFVTLTTIAWSALAGTLALPSIASAATLSAGDLIKASGPAVYYYANDMKRYVFPNEKTYFSWFVDFSSVKTITDGELAAIDIGGNVTIRPGTKLVKITTDPKVYAVTRCGNLHWVESEAIATALWGSSWASRVVDVPDSFFVNYTIGSSVPTAVHPDGALVSYAGSASKYVVWSGQKRLFASDAAFSANMLNAANVIQTTISYPNGSDVTGRESNLADVVCTTAPVTGSVSIALASDTPAGVVLPKGSASNSLAKYNVTAGTTDVTLTGLKIHHVGVGAVGDFANVYLYDGSGTRLTSGRTINSTSNLVEFNSLNVTVPAGQTKSFLVVGDVSTSASAGGQHSFEVQDAASAVISGTATVGGTFPVRGNVFTIGTTSAARVDVQKGTSPTNPNIGSTEAEVSNFKITANTNDVEIRRITLLQAGDIANTDLTDLKLYQGTTLVASTASLAGDKIVLNFSPAYVLANGTTKTFSLKARIAGRSGRTIKTYVEYSTDVLAIDRVYNSGAQVCLNVTSTGCTTSSASFDGQSGNFITVTTQGGQLTVAFNGPSNQNVAKGSQDVVLFKFSLLSADNTVEIRNLDFNIQGQTVGGVAGKVKGTSGTEYFRDIKIKDLDTGATVMGPTSMSSSLANSATASGVITLSDSFNLAAGVIRNLAITADLSNTEDGGDFFTSGTSTYKVVLGDASSALFGSSDVRIVSTGEYLSTSTIVPNASITGNPTIVKAASLTVALASSPSSATIVKNQSNVDSVGLVFTAGAQSDMLITAVKLTGSGDTSGSFALATLNDVINSCALYDGATQVGLSANPDTTAGTMNITNMNLTIPKGTSKTLVAKCTADSVVAQSTGDRYAVGIATASTDVTAQDADGNSVTASLTAGVTSNAGTTGQAVIMTVKSGGTLTIATDSLRQSTILVGGTGVWQNLAQYKATAQYEDVRLDRMTVTSTGDAANFTSIAVAVGGVVKTSDLLPSGSNSSKDLDLTVNPITVPKDTSITFQVWGKIANVAPSSTVSGATTGVARSGNLVKLGIASNVTTGEYDSNYLDKFNVKAVGLASGNSIYATSTNMTGGTTGNQFVIRKAQPVVARQSLSNTTLTSGADMDLYKVRIGAEGPGIAVKKVVFDFSKSTSTGSSLTLSNFRIRKGVSEMTAGTDYTITDLNGTSITGATLSMASSSGSIVVNFVNEETITLSGFDYTLHATVGGTVVSGDSVNFSLNRTTDTTVYTGYLTDAYYAANRPGSNINTTTSPSGAADVFGTFVWSDMSEVPHSANSSSNSGSFDWTNDLYVQDLTSSQVLSR